jgi:hypothetical protein
LAQKDLVLNLQGLICSNGFQNQIPRT